MGINVTGYESLKEEVLDQIDKELFRKIKHLRVGAAVRMYKLIIRTISSYTSETSPDTSRAIVTLDSK